MLGIININIERLRGVKRISAVLLAISVGAALFGCIQRADNEGQPLVIESPFKSFQDIPGVTEKEIIAIESLKRERLSLVFGVPPSTEAFLNENGEAGGYAALLCEWLTGLFDVQFNLEILEWVELTEKLNAGEADFSIHLAPDEENLEHYYMTDIIAERQLIEIRLAKNRELGQILSERPPKYAFISGSPTESLVSAMEKSYTYEPVWVDGYAEAYRTLERGKADAFIAPGIAKANFAAYDNVVSEYFYPLISSPASMATASPALESFISVLNKALRNGAMPYLKYLYNLGNDEYLRHEFMMSLSGEEKAYLQNTASVPLAVQYHNYPVVFYNANDKKWDGITFDLLREVERLAGLVFEVVNDEHTGMDDLMEMLYDGKAHMYSDLVCSTRQEPHFIRGDYKLMADQYALLSKTETPNIKLNEVPYARVALIRNTAYAEMFRTWFPQAVNTREYENANDAFLALEQGEVDMIMAAKSNLLYFLNYYEFSGYKANYLFNYFYESSFAFNKEQTVLRSIMDKALSVIDTEVVVGQWLTKTFDYKSRIMAARLPWLVGAILLALVVVVLLLFLFYKKSRVLMCIEAAHDDIKHRDLLLCAANNVSSVLFEPDLGCFEDSLWKSMEIMAEAVGVDRICIWKNCNDRSRLHFSLNYEWENGSFRSDAEKGSLAPDLWFDEHPAFNKMILKGNCINSLVSDLPPAERAQLAPRNIISLFAVPVLLQNKLWGYVSFDNCKREYLFTDSEVLILRSVSRMLAHSVIRNEMTRNILDTTALMEEAKEAAEQANRAKSEFLSHISHEIRTPMNTILGVTEIQLQKLNNSPDVDEAFSLIYSSGNLLLNIINDILDLSRIEAGKLELHPVRYDIPSLVYDTMQLTLLRYDSKPIDFKVKIDENTPLDLFGDELRLKQILNNILSNAFKYTDKGRIELSVTAETNREMFVQGPESLTKCVLVLQVSDTGQGMSEEQIGKLFEQYTRFNLDVNQSVVGTGLGMNITKRFIDMMNGEIFVESVVGKGSVITVRLPQESIGSALCGPELAENLQSGRFQSIIKLRKGRVVHEHMPYGKVLIVDDVESNLFVAKGMMLPYGLKIETVTGGSKALEQVRNGRVYDIIFMDHMMPGMDGIEATALIRETGYTHPIVALTANAVVGQAEMFLRNGFDGFISKPIDARELNAILNRFIRDRQIQNSGAPVSVSLPEMDVSPELAAMVVRDIKKTIGVLEEILPRMDAGDDEDIVLFTTTVHGAKSALANVGETELSMVALKLEQAGMDGKISAIASETAEFISALRLAIEKLSNV